ncbi:MAG: tRNA pseudouridine(55) synthase TruB [Chloroflexota bacterium]
MITGILVVDKPQGWTSHDVVAGVRRFAGQRQVGHAGTLDPLATGVLLVALGRATKLTSYLMDSTKVYRVEIVLGATTVTDDAEAPMLAYLDPSGVTRPDIESRLPAFTGDINQVPPKYSAVRASGKKLYSLARKGIDVEASPRAVSIRELTVESWECPRLRLLVRCGPGMYIRSLARDLGAALGVGAYVHALRRVRSGTFTEGEARSLDCVSSAAATGPDGLAGLLEPADRAVLDWPALLLSDADVVRVRNGRMAPAPGTAAGNVRIYGSAGLIALGKQSGEWVHPFLVMHAAR